MATCDRQTLLTEASCFQCLDSHQLRMIMAALLCDIKTIINADYDPGNKLAWLTAADTLADTGIPQPVQAASTPCHKAIITALSTNASDITFGGIGGPDNIVLSAGTSYLLEAPDGHWFDLLEVQYEGTAGDGISILYI